MLKYIFVASFIVACVLQGVRWEKLGIIDGAMWANQAHYVEVGDPAEFDRTTAYGHPGGPLIDGTIAIHVLVGISHQQALLIFLTVFNSLIVAASVALCFVLRNSSLWWIVALGTLSLHPLFNDATPSSAVASLLAVLLCLVTLFVYEHEERATLASLAAWSLVAGLLVSTRVDIGIAVGATCTALLVQHLGVRKAAGAAGGAFVLFFVSDPFMWFVPVTHIKDLLSEVVYHYAQYPANHLDASSVFTISSLALIGMCLAGASFVMRKKIPPAVPLGFASALLALTALLYVVFLTAHSQALRYFQPIILIWEVLLPLYVFSLISAVGMKYRMRLGLESGITCLLISYPAFILLHLLQS